MGRSEGASGSRGSLSLGCSNNMYVCISLSLSIYIYIHMYIHTYSNDNSYNVMIILMIILMIIILIVIVIVTIIMLLSITIIHLGGPGASLGLDALPAAQHHVLVATVSGFHSSEPEQGEPGLPGE